MNDVKRTSISLTEAELENNPQYALDLAHQNHVIITNDETTPLYVMLSIDEFDRLRKTAST